MNRRPVSMRRVTVVKEPQHTQNAFGPLAEIAGKQLLLVERNRHGDCLCMFQGEKGKNLVDVDKRDVAAIDNV